MGAHPRMAKLGARAGWGGRVRARARARPQGLQQRDAKQRADAEDVAQALTDAGIELACFSALQAREARAAPERAEQMRGLLAAQREREAALQARFKELSDLRGDLLEALRSSVREQQQQQVAAAAEAAA